MIITLKTLAQATEQQIFDQVARHLLKQKVRAVTEAGNCKYRNPDGLMCAAGCLISDEEYDPRFDHAGTWENVVGRYKETVTSVHKDFITQLQKMHDADTWQNEVDFAQRLAKFALDHNLQFNFEELSK